MYNNIKEYSHFGSDYLSNIFYVNNKYLVNLTDFNFIEGKTKYKIFLYGKGYNWQWFRFVINDKSYVTNNVWESTTPKYPTKTKIGVVTQIDKEDITSDDIILDNLKYISTKNQKELKKQIIEDIQKQKRKEVEENEFCDKFWKDRKILLSISPDSDEWIFYVIKHIKKDKIKYEMFHSCDGIYHIEYPLRYDEILYKKTDNLELAKETIYKFIKKYITGKLSINLYHDQLYVFIVTKFEIHDRIKTKRENYSNYCKDMHICYGIIKCRENIDPNVAIY